MTVINRVRVMEKGDVIRGYSADVNYERLGYGIVGIIGVIAEGAGLKRLEEEVAKFNNIRLVYEVTGDTDVVLIGNFKDMKDLQSFVKERLLAKNYVTKTVTQIVTNTYKDTPKIDIE